jgi:poly(A) polymerase
MSSSHPKREFAVDVVKRLKQAGFQGLWAGGCVRDSLLRREPKDYDVATDARPEEVRELFGHRRTLPVGASFGVILVLGPKPAGDVEVATFRTEGPYLDGRRPDSVAFSSPEEDAGRRDFTINGMFYDPITDQVLDFVGGEQDLKAGIVRAIGDPRERMREDKLRMLRAVRFAATLQFELDRETADAVREMAEEIHVVSAERIAEELKRMLVDPHRKRAMQLAQETGLLPLIFPELAPMIGASADQVESNTWGRTLQMLDHLQQPRFELAAATLLHAMALPPAAALPLASPDEQKTRGLDDRPRSLCKRLRLSNQETDDIVWLLVNQSALADAPNLSKAKLKRLMAQPLVRDELSLHRVKSLAAGADLNAVEFCEEFLRNTPQEEINPPALITGDDLITQGLKPGRHFKELLEAVRDAQLNGKIETKQQALNLAARLQANG